MREFALLEHVYQASSSLDPRIIIPPGDDMGMIDADGGPVLAAVDQVIDGCHVRLETTPLALIGRKAITRCLSDVAAMAARPIGTLASVALPSDFGEERATGLFDAMRAAANAFHAPLFGGDVAIHRSTGTPLTCAITALAAPLDADHLPVLRSGARIGDGVFLTGRLRCTLDPETGQGHHLTFSPRIDEAIELYRVLGKRLHALIDLSDGLGRDAGHVARASDVSIEIDTATLPLESDLTWQDAVATGEVYELCLCASGDVPDAIASLPITRIGTVISRDDQGAVLVNQDGKQVDISAQGWEHHA